MAHEIEVDSNGKGYAFFASETPAWHGLGTVLKDAPSVQDAWHMACPWELFKLDLSASIPTAEGREYMPIETHKAVFRSDGKHIGTVGADYELEQPYEVLEFFEPFIKSGLIELEAGGTLRNGTRMWALGKVKGAESDIVPGDPIKNYLLAATAFDGTMARVIKGTATRVVCANTLAIALREDSDNEWKVRHTKGLKDRVANVQRVIDDSLKAHADSVDKYKLLASRKVPTSLMKTYVERVILPDDADPKKASAIMKNKVIYVQDLLDSQKGLELVPAARGTMWQAYNAVSEYVTHHAARNADNRLNNQWFGEGASLNARALEMALTY